MKRNLTNYLTLFKATFFLSAFTFGGGYVIIPLMKNSTQVQMIAQRAGREPIPAPPVPRIVNVPIRASPPCQLPACSESWRRLRLVA